MKIFLLHIYRWLLKLERILLIISSLLVTGIICAAVFMRYIMHDDLFAYDELVMVAAFWLYFVGAAYGSYEDSHIKADIIQILTPHFPRFAAYVRLTARTLEALLALCISYWAWSLMAWQLTFKGKTMGWGIPIAVPQSAIFIGFSLMSLYAIVHLIQSIQELRGNVFLKEDNSGER